MALAVIGLGSELAGDDAIGLTLVSRLAERLRGASVEFLHWPDADALSIAYDLMSLGRPALLVDCADMGLPPGSHRLFAPDEVKLVVKHSPVSVHGLGIAEALGLASALGFGGPLRFFGVQPFDLSYGTPLSAAMQARFEDLLEALGQATRRCLGELSAISPTADGVR